MISKSDSSPLRGYHDSDRDAQDARLPQKDETLRLLRGEDCSNCDFENKKKPHDIADATLGYCPFEFNRPRTCNWWKRKIGPPDLDLLEQFEKEVAERARIPKGFLFQRRKGRRK